MGWDKMEVFHANEVYVNISKILDGTKVFNVLAGTTQFNIDNTANIEAYPVMTIEPLDEESGVVNLSGDFFQRDTIPVKVYSATTPIEIDTNEVLKFDIDNINGFVTLDDTDITDNVSGRPISVLKDEDNEFTITTDAPAKVTFTYKQPESGNAVSFVENISISDQNNVYFNSNLYNKKDFKKLGNDLVGRIRAMYLDSQFEDYLEDGSLVRIHVNYQNSDGREIDTYIFGVLEGLDITWQDNDLVYENVRILGCDIIRNNN